ncbi:hypothetical protein PIB30_080227, partial [Stylosanthes scabra]|nr:hypothetical protein [Stylosanthes scabra]
MAAEPTVTTPRTNMQLAHAPENQIEGQEIKETIISGGFRVTTAAVPGGQNGEGTPAAARIKETTTEKRGKPTSGSGGFKEHRQRRRLMMAEGLAGDGAHVNNGDRTGSLFLSSSLAATITTVGSSSINDDDGGQNGGSFHGRRRRLQLDGNGASFMSLTLFPSISLSLSSSRFLFLFRSLMASATAVVVE